MNANGKPEPKLGRRLLAAAVTAVSALALALPTPALAAAWEVSKSKTATNLDESYQSQVTLSLPAAEYSPCIDVAFVLDGSTSTDQATLAAQAAELLSELAAMDNVTVKASVTVSGGTTPILYTSGELQELTDTFAGTLTTIITSKEWDSAAGRSGSNLQAGVDVASGYLQKDGSVAASDKYLVILSDGGARMWWDGENALSNAFAPNADSTNVWWNSNSDWVDVRYKDAGSGTTFAAVVEAAAQEDANVDAYAMTEDEKNDASAEYARTGTIPEGVANPTAIVSDGYFTTYEAATYHAGMSIIAAEAFCNVTLVSYPYHNEGKESQANYEAYIASFKSWLAENGVTRYDTSTLDAEQIFSSIKDEMVQLVSTGSTITDIIGRGTDDQGNAYDFDFVDSAESLTLTVGDAVLAAQQGTATEANETSRYDFVGADGQSQFVLHYYANGTDGASDECFILDINVDVTKDALVQLTYDVTLTNPQQPTDPGTHTYTGLYTNKSATLRPVDGKGNAGDPEDFERPSVSYTVTVPEPTPSEDPTDDTPATTTRQRSQATTTTKQSLPKTGDSSAVVYAAGALCIAGIIAVVVSRRIARRK